VLISLFLGRSEVDPVRVLVGMSSSAQSLQKIKQVRVFCELEFGGVLSFFIG
jgi:uncharacterized membrane protein